MLTDNQFTYVVQRLFSILGVSEKSYNIDKKRRTIVLGKHRVVFHLLDKDMTDRLMTGKLEYNIVKVNYTQDEVVVFSTTDTQFVEDEGNVIKINFDLITLPFLLLSRKEEVGCQKDQYGRFSYEDSLAKKYGFIDYPIVDEYAFLLKECLEPYVKLERKEKSYSLLLTHDVDTLQRYNGFLGSCRSILAGDLLLRKSLKICMNSIVDYINVKKGKKFDPEKEGLLKLLNVSKQYGVKSEFYFRGITVYGMGNTYDLESIPKEFWKLLDENEMKVGFHGDMGTSADKKKFEKEISFVRKSLAQYNIDRGRQHYLIFDAKVTPGIWAENGIKFDSTLGFFNHEGFMCGTCHEYPLYDIENDCELGVIERPLLVMDGTLKGYRKLSREKALERMLFLCEQVKRVNGQMVILWHNGSTYREWERWFIDVYCNFLKLTQ